MHRASPTPGHDKVIHALALVFVFLLTFISPMALGALGWNYDSPGGAGPTRFHPATFAMLLLFAAILVRDGNPLTSLLLSLARDPLTGLFLMVWAVVFYHGVAMQGLPAAGMIDTFLLPALMLLGFRRLAPETTDKLAWLFHFAFLINALIGVGEFASGLRLTPYVAGGVAITDDWRSTALLGHPLSNALLTGCYAIILMIGGAPELQGPKRAAMLLLQFAGMAAFGGRASLVLLLVIGALVSGQWLLRFLAGRKMPLAYVTAGAILLPVLLAALAGAYELGVFDKFIQRFVNDGGSAKARVVMFELFQAFTWQELLFGPQQAHLTYQTLVYRIEFGIESLWIAFALYYGIIPAVIFFCALLLFLVSVTYECQKRAWIVLVYFFVINSTFLGIAAKTVSFTTMLLMLLVLLPMVRGRGRPPHPVNGIRPSYRNPATC